VAVLRTHAFPGPDIKLPPFVALPFGARVPIAKEERGFAVTVAGRYLPRSHLAAVDAKDADFVAVAERFVGTPYLWGGKSSLGIDCSGLVQVSLQAAGVASPRDTYMQEAQFKNDVALTDLKRGDLIFWKGHVAIARDAQSIVHANAHHMMVAIEPVAAAIERIKKAGSAVTGVKRP
jgi:cell wall-associated NlpC family hydrolase